MPSTAAAPRTRPGYASQPTMTSPAGGMPRPASPVPETRPLPEPARKPSAGSRRPLLRVTDLRMHFPIYKGLFRRQVGTIKAVDDVSFEIEEGETLGEYLGICKYDKNKNVTKKRKCSSVAIRDFSYEIKEEEKKLFLNKCG